MACAAWHRGAGASREFSHYSTPLSGRLSNGSPSSRYSSSTAVALVPAQLLEAGRLYTSVHAGGERAALEAVTAECARIESGGGAGLDDAGDSARARSPHGTGQGRGVSPGSRRVGGRGRQMRRNTGPSVMPAAPCQRRSARTGQSSLLP